MGTTHSKIKMLVCGCFMIDGGHIIYMLFNIYSCIQCRTFNLDTFVGTKGVSQNHLLSFDDNKVLKLSIGYAKHLFKCTGS